MYSDIDKAMASPSASIIVVEVVGAILFLPTSFIFGIIKLYELICASLLFLLLEISIDLILFLLAKLSKSNNSFDLPDLDNKQKYLFF